MDLTISDSVLKDLKRGLMARALACLEGGLIENVLLKIIDAYETGKETVDICYKAEKEGK